MSMVVQLSPVREQTMSTKTQILYQFRKITGGNAAPAMPIHTKSCSCRSTWPLVSSATLLEKTVLALLLVVASSSTVWKLVFVSRLFECISTIKLVFSLPSRLH